MAHARCLLPAIILTAVLLVLGGCGAQAGWSLGELGDRAGMDEAVAADPLGYLEGRLDRCRELRSYTTILYRQERLGSLFKQLRPVEKVLAMYQADPLSVRIVWLDEDSRFVESVYAAGRNEDRQLILERHGLLGGPGTLWRVDPATPIALGEAKYPTTDFGLARLMKKSLDMPADPAVRAGLVKYVGVRQVDLTGQEVHLFELRGTEKSDYPLQELMIDAATGWPAGTRLWLDEEKTRLDAMYLYTHVQPGVRFAPENFTVQGPIPEQAGLPEDDAPSVARR